MLFSFVFFFFFSSRRRHTRLQGDWSSDVCSSDLYFRLGGGTIKGISKPGEIVWSRIYLEKGKLWADIGRAKVIELPRAETERRWRTTTPQWPIMHAVIYGISRDQMMAKHQSNHVQVAYAPDAA